MKLQEAIGILLLSPFYFRLDPAQRMQLAKEYCELYSEISKAQSESTRLQHP